MFTWKQLSNIENEQQSKIKIFCGQVDGLIVAPRGAGLAIEAQPMQMNQLRLWVLTFRGAQRIEDARATQAGARA